jgi:hypothetical protein
MNDKYQQAHEEARKRFLVDPSKCYQRHIRELWAELEPRETLPSLKGATVSQINREQAESIILKYEWLAGDPRNKNPLGRGVQAYYGLWLNGELLGANCLGRIGGGVGNICGKYLKQTGYLMRGACVPHAPKNAASFMTRYTCMTARKDCGWKVFFAYSDTHDAAEMGTIYQACGWYFLGEGLGRLSKSGHLDFLSPDKDEIITSYMLNHGTADERIKGMGWTGKKGEKRQTLKQKGWTVLRRMDKKKWAWFEGTQTEKLKMAEACRSHLGIKKADWPLPYPKRVTL